MANRQVGADIHATAIDNLLSGQTIRKVPGWLNLLLLVLLCPAIFFYSVALSKTKLYLSLYIGYHGDLQLVCFLVLFQLGMVVGCAYTLGVYDGGLYCR